MLHILSSVRKMRWFKAHDSSSTAGGTSLRVHDTCILHVTHVFHITCYTYCPARVRRGRGGASSPMTPLQMSHGVLSDESWMSHGVLQALWPCFLSRSICDMLCNMQYEIWSTKYEIRNMKYEICSMYQICMQHVPRNAQCDLNMKRIRNMYMQYMCCM